MEKQALFSEIFDFWPSLSEAERSQLCESTQSLEYARDALVNSSGSCAGLTIVRRGCLRVALLSEEGREITLYRLHAGDFCLLSASCVIEAITFDVQVVAEEDSECYLLSASTFGEISARHKEVEIFALNKTVERFSEVMWVLQQILFRSLDCRLAAFLYDEGVRLNSNELVLTHEQIARNIASAREAVSRLLKYFENEGLVALSRGKITLLDRARLRRLALS